MDFKRLDVWEVDRFFDEVKELLEAFKKCTAPYDESRDTFYEATKFFDVPAAKAKHVIIGMFLSLISMSNGDITKLKFDFKLDAPFVEIKFDHFEGDVL